MPLTLGFYQAKAIINLFVLDTRVAELNAQPTQAIDLDRSVDTTWWILDPLACVRFYIPQHEAKHLWVFS